MLATLYAAMMFQAGGGDVSWDIRSMLHNMGGLALTVVVIIFLL
jgi:hypothetical protein